MRDAMTVSVSHDVKKKVDSLAKKKDVDRSSLVQEALQLYLFQQELHEIRRKAIPRARTHGIFADEDIFRIVS